MSRIRTIKPEFFTSEDIVALSPLARLLYIAIWCEADKEGRLIWRPRQLRMRFLPADDCDIEALCQELLDGGLVSLYGEGLAYVPSFSTHQHVNPRESVSKLPAPDEPPRGPKKISKEVRAEVMERDGNRCVRCCSTDDLTLDHILPQSLGGPHVADNLRVMCRPCNCGRPVSGDGLRDDLAKDGLTIESLREVFGIDASRRVGTRANLELTGQFQNDTRREEGKGREGKGKEDASGTRDASLSVLSIGFGFPREGSVAYSPFAALIRANAPGRDVDFIAGEFRSFCSKNNIAFDHPSIGKVLATFCKKQRAAA